jgi:signal transduction histidine kinase
METSEELREALVSLQRENERLRKETAQANRLVQELESLLRLQIDDDPFASVFSSLGRIFSFKQAMVLTENDDGGLRCIASNSEALISHRFIVGAFFKKIMSGRVVTTFDNTGLEEWRKLETTALSPQQPALYLPISVRDRRGILVLLRDVGQSAFDRSHVALAKRFSILASHAFANKYASQLVRNSEARALAAEEASRIKTLFIANMSHELRTPLNAIIGFSEIIHNEIYGPIGVKQYGDYAGDILNSGRHLLALINNLLLQSTIEAGQHVARIEKLDLDGEIAHALKIMKIEAERMHVALAYTPPLQKIIVLADQRSLHQILLNVIGNAIKFSPFGGAVRIAVDSGADTGNCTINIVDHGCGIPAGTLAQLGKPFVQADNSFSRRFQGTGLGLSICFGLAQAMGASIQVDSMENAGTTVVIKLNCLR